MSTDYPVTSKHVDNAMQGSRIWSSATLHDTLYQQAWFAGLYIASLVCLTAIGTSVRWVLNAL